MFVATSKGDGYISFWEGRVSPGTLIGSYNGKTNTLEVFKDCVSHGCYAAMTIPYVGGNGYLDVFRDIPELGFSKAVELPYSNYRRLLRVSRDEIQHGYAVALEIGKYSPCAGCIYQTGEPLLPCAVNPSLFGGGCREYSTN